MLHLIVGYCDNSPLTEFQQNLNLVRSTFRENKRPATVFRNTDINPRGKGSNTNPSIGHTTNSYDTA